MSGWLHPSKRFARIVIVGSSVLAASCAVEVRPAGPSPDGLNSEPSEPTPRREPLSRYGNPKFYEVFGERYYTLKTNSGFRQRGIASWYGKQFHGRKTSSGEIYDMYQMTAAHKRLLLPSYVKVTNLENGRYTVLRVNDRGPFHGNRIIDLSYAAALKLGVVDKGTALVEIEAVDAGAQQTVAVAAPTKTIPDGVNELYLQIGAFAERPNAERLIEHVSKRLSNGLNKRVRIYESVNGAQSIYRVQVGPIETADLADQVVDTLVEIGVSDHHFITN